MKSTDIVGYSYRADLFCEGCILPAMGVTATLNRTTEENLDYEAEHEGIDRKDVGSFHSDEFPKVVRLDMYRDYDSDVRCSNCGKVLGS